MNTFVTLAAAVQLQPVQGKSHFPFEIAAPLCLVASIIFALGVISAFRVKEFAHNLWASGVKSTRTQYALPILLSLSLFIISGVLIFCVYFCAFKVIGQNNEVYDVKQENIQKIESYYHVTGLTGEKSDENSYVFFYGDRLPVESSSWDGNSTDGKYAVQWVQDGTYQSGYLSIYDRTAKLLNEQGQELK